MCCLVSSRAFRRYPICCHCSGVHHIMHIGALCSHGTKNNQNNSTTQPRTQLHTMTKKPPSVTAAERTWLTKPPYKRRSSCYRRQCCGAGTCGEEVNPRPSSHARCGAHALFIWRAHPSERYCRPDRRDADELPGPLVRRAQDLRRGVEGGRCGAPP